VVFDEPITGCSWLATLNDNDDGFVDDGEIGVERQDSNELRVITYTSAGGLADLAQDDDGFSVAALC
jgi:hypothetical protein